MEDLRKKIKDYFSQPYQMDTETTESLKPDFIKYLRLIDPTNKEDFTTAVRIAVDHYISRKDFAREFGVSQSTLERYVSGKSAPHLAMRPAVINRIIERLQE